jgi:hypothetical protein
MIRALRADPRPITPECLLLLLTLAGWDCRKFWGLRATRTFSGLSLTWGTRGVDY